MEATRAEDLETASTPNKKSNLREAKRRQIQEDVLDSISRGISVTEFCCAAEISRQTYYNWLEHDPEFARRVEQMEDTRASFIDSVLWHAACRAIGDPRYIRAATAYLSIHEQREKRRDQQRRWEAEQKRWEADHERWQAEHARWEAEQKQKKEAAPKAPEKPKRARVLRRRRTPPLPPKWVRQLVTEITSAVLAAHPTQSSAAPPAALQITGDGASVPPPLPPLQPAS